MPPKKPREEQPKFEHPQSQSMQPVGVVSNPDMESPTDARITELEALVKDLIQNHVHDGGGATRINFNTDIIGLFETVSAAPTGVPKSPYDQVKIYVNSTTYRLYWYDANANVWHYVTATA